MDRQSLLGIITSKYCIDGKRLNPWFGRSRGLEEAEILKQYTMFLSNDTSYTIRLDVLRQGIIELPKCLYCNNEFQPKHFGLQNNGKPILYCSIPCGNLDTKDQRKKTYNVTRSKSPYKHHTLEWYIWKYGDESGKEKFKIFADKCAHTLENFQKRHGVEKGEKLYKETIEKKSQSLERFIELYGEQDGLFAYTAWVNSNGMTLEKSITRYGLDLGTIVYDNWLKKIQNKTGNQYKGGKVIDYFLEKYGSEEGLAKYLKWHEATQVSKAKASKESLRIFLPLERLLKSKNHTISDIYYGYADKREFFQWSPNLKQHFFYDFTIRSQKLIIEYNGSLWHPTKEQAETYPDKNIPRLNMSFKEKYEWDQIKYNETIKLGFSIITLTDNDDVNIIAEKIFPFLNFITTTETEIMSFLSNKN